MLSHPDFFNALGGLVESLPFQKALSKLGLAFAWSSFPEKAKQELTPLELGFACTQRVLDPEPRQHLAIHIQLLAYLYPLEGGIPVVDRGLRHDLSERMQNPYVFHPLSTYLAHLPPALPPPAAGKPLESAAQRRQRLVKLAAETGVVA